MTTKPTPDALRLAQSALAERTRELTAAQAEIERLKASPATVKVKPLVWNDTPSFCLDCMTHDAFGLYQITDELVLFVGHSTTGDRFFSIEAAKAAAQADFECRIRSALDMPAPQEGGDA